ncbi:MAG: GNAT family N-acetyltransferase [Candidatus Acidiferrales bacterium]
MIASRRVRLATVTVRVIQPQDFEVLYQLDQACYPPGIAYSRQALREFLAAPGAQAWVGEERGEPVGFIIVEQFRRDRGHIITLDVREDRRRRGLGSELLAAAEAWLAEQGIGRVSLETGVDNGAGVAFWTRAGYSATARLPRYYLGRHDAYRMEKELSPR